MNLAWSEYLRGQLERQMPRRAVWFAVLSFILFLPLSLVWSVLAARRARLRMRAKSPVGDEPWIVSVGNVSVGGTGKSPVVRALARWALNDGFDVAVLTRGVGKDAGLMAPILHFSRHSEPMTSQSWASLSDESLEHVLQLQQNLPSDASLWFAEGSHRAELLAGILQRRSALKSQRGVESSRQMLVIVDDGLQQTALPVHRDIVVWDPHSVVEAPQFCLPFGPYRMGSPRARPWALSLPRADVIVWSRVKSISEKNEFLNFVTRARERIFQCPRAPIAGEPLPSESPASALETDFRFVALEETWLARVLPNEPAPGFSLESIGPEEFPAQASLLCGIARPERFAQSFHSIFESPQHRPVVVGSAFLADHGELNSAARRVIRSQHSVVTTLKDLCRWWETPEFRELMRSGRLFVLCLEVKFIPESGDLKCESLAELFQFRSQVNNER